MEGLPATQTGTQTLAGTSPAGAVSPTEAPLDALAAALTLPAAAAASSPSLAVASAVVSAAAAPAPAATPSLPVTDATSVAMDNGGSGSAFGVDQRLEEDALSPLFSPESSPLLVAGGRGVGVGSTRGQTGTAESHSAAGGRECVDSGGGGGSGGVGGGGLAHATGKPSGSGGSLSASGSSGSISSGGREASSGSMGGGVIGGFGGGGGGGGNFLGLEPWVLHMLRAVGLISAWYFFSMCLSLYNKILIGEKHGHFPAPLLMTTFHFLLQYAISALLLKYVCPASWTPTTRLSWRDYFMRIVPTAVTTALDIALSNLSLAFITLTFYTMCKSSAPVFLLLFAFGFRVEPMSMKLLGVMVVISVGVLFTVAGETQFRMLGFILVMCSALTSGLRWVLIQVLLQKDKLGLTNPLVTLCYLTPIMALVCSVFSLVHEPWHQLHTSPYFDTWEHAGYSLVIMVCGGCLAFFMIMAEFLLVLETSAVTLSVAGTVKEGVTILVSHWVFGDRFTRINLLGIFIIMVGVSLFNVYKLSKGHGHGPREVKAALTHSRSLSGGSAGESPRGGDEWQHLLPASGAAGGSDHVRSPPSASAIRNHNHHHQQQAQQQLQQQQKQSPSQQQYGAGGAGLQNGAAHDEAHVVIATSMEQRPVAASSPSLTVTSPRSPQTRFVLEISSHSREG